jgi:hypothetical protein
MLDLPEVTLVAINTVCHELTDMAVADCMRHANFGDVKVFTDNVRNQHCIYIPKFENLTQAGQFSTYELPKYFKTKHVLFIHWDSWIIDPGMWNPEFLDYDYVGAPWWYEELNVGNSGFCLRSTALLRFLADNSEQFPMMMPEDHALCRKYQLELPQFKWAPEKLAIDFSFERSRPAIDSRHFGYHGMFNWPFILPPDKLAERMVIARNDPYVQKSGMIEEIDRLANVYWIKI